jgi:hypothetical protein
MVTMDSDSLTPSTAVSPLAAPAAPVFISCCPEELVEVELEALRQGRARARADGAQALCRPQAISEAAAAACERALAEQYVALDEARFRDVFTLAWCAGYHEEIAKSPHG